VGVFPAACLAGEHLKCATSGVSVSFSDLPDADAACEAASYALAFLERNGFRQAGQFEIEVVDALPADHLPHTLGSFDHRQRKIRVLSYAALRDRRMTILGLPLNWDLYRSLVSHEVAHLVASRNFSFPGPSLAAQEYIACVTQIASLPVDLRQMISAIYRGEGFATTAQINLTYYLSDPNLFTVQAYRHYLQPENGAKFMQELLLVRGLVLD
jgi:hypothetical protein